MQIEEEEDQEEEEDDNDIAAHALPYDYIYEMHGQAQISNITLINFISNLLEEISQLPE